MSFDARVANLFGVAGKRALVTGATSGIGRMIARGLAEAGVEVLVVARKPDEVAEFAAELSAFAPCEGIAADVASEDGLVAIGRAIGRRPLHIVVNNAGTNADTPLEANGRETFDMVLGLNLTAPFRVIQTVLPNLEKAATADDPARVINIASIAALDPGPFENFAYSASKSGLAMLTRHLGRPLARRNITCNAIAPGLFPSRMTERFIGMSADDAPPLGWGAPLGNRVGRQDDVAGATIYLCSRAGAWITGVLLPVSGGVSTVT